MVDWSAGHYETIAEQLRPAAQAVVDDADPRSGERVLDVGCGTGNAALLAAERGAVATGVDPAPRLLEVARQSAQAPGLRTEFLTGDAAAIPAPDASFDLVVSVFGMIFAPEAEAAVAEIARVTKPTGRVVFSAWLAEGAIALAGRERALAIARAAGAGDRPPPFAWHDPDQAWTLFEPHGFTLAARRCELAFTADSPEAFAASEFAEHPVWVSGRAVLDAGAVRGEVERRVTELYVAANENPDGFRVTSRYLIYTGSRDRA